MSRRIIECARCGRLREHRSRHLCASCFVMAHLNGTAEDYPRTTHTLADMAEDYQILAGRGMDLTTIAAKLGYASARSFAGALSAAYHKGLLPKTALPHGLWSARDRHRLSGPLEPHERRLLTHYATTSQPNPCQALGLSRESVRAYRYCIRRKLAVATFDDALKAFVAGEVLAA